MCGVCSRGSAPPKVEWEELAKAPVVKKVSTRGRVITPSQRTQEVLKHTHVHVDSTTRGRDEACCGCVPELCVSVCLCLNVCVRVYNTVCVCVWSGPDVSPQDG
jgi:hypothetical protein